MVMSMFALLRNNPQPTEQQIELAIKGFSAFSCPMWNYQVLSLLAFENPHLLSSRQRK
jgi:aerobic-type carbon monoxide dehydrogenase small subunit (CoxS/CutS family)